MNPMSNLDPTGGTIYVRSSGEKTECYQAKGFFSKISNYLFGRKAKAEDVENFHNKCFKQLAMNKEATLDDIGQYAKQVNTLFRKHLISDEAFDSIREHTVQDITTMAKSYATVVPRLSDKIGALAPFANIDKDRLKSEITFIQTWVNGISPNDTGTKIEKETLDRIRIIEMRLRVGL